MPSLTKDSNNTTTPPLCSLYVLSCGPCWIYELQEIYSRQATLKDEAWVVPLAWMEAGEMAAEQKNFEETRKCFEACKKFKSYDWEKTAEFRMFVREQKMNRKK